MKFAMRLCLPKVTRESYAHDTATVWLLKKTLQNDTTNRQGNEEGRNHMGPHPRLRTIGNQ